MTFADLSLPEKRAAAWQELPWPCRFCGEPRGRRCVTSTGTRTVPHADRLADITAYKAGQESDDTDYAELNAKVGQLATTLEQTDAALARMTTERDDLKVEVQFLNRENTGLIEQNKVLERDLAATKSERAALVDRVDDLLDRIAELEQPTDPAPTSRVLPFGIGVDQLGTIETKAGAPVAYHRTYFTLPASGLHTIAIAQAKADHAAGRTPVISFKLPGGSKDWAGAATGKFDAPIKATVDALAALGKPVIVAVHHEPEDDGTIADFKAMTAHLVDVIKRPTVQFWVCFMGYHQLYGGSEWKLDKLHVPGVDGYGFDPYLSFGASSDKWTDQRTSYYAKFGAWAKANGVQWGIWETGINEQAITSGRAEAKTWFADMAAGAKQHGASMWIYFSSETTKDGKHDWRISTSGANKEAQMAAVIKQYAPTKEN